MLKPIDILRVCMDGKTVGRLAMAPDRRCVFEYDAGWIETGFSISPFYLPLRSGAFTARPDPFNGLFGVFNDSLPDGWGNLLLDRMLIREGIRPGTLSPLDRLSIVGSSGMGALTYHPENTLGGDADNTDLNYLAGEVEKILSEDNSGDFELLFRKNGSSGGASPKVLITVDGQHWLVKFRSANDPKVIGAIEYQCSLNAKKCGIEMPETRLFEGKYFGARRFDREGDIRYHMHTAGGLLYASHRLPSLDYTDLMKATMILTRNMEEVSKMYRLMVFNVLSGNKDDHAKNFSFLFKDGTWGLSPAYDLVPSDGFNGNHCTTINGKGNPEPADMLEAAENAGFPKKQAQVIYDEIKTTYCDEF
ncbi:MAG: type II toxin-antitoxin system HipA family toxin [Bacteroidia bacterium]|nr:type II toxin-antitoxin system HipA family toxin [Bacteroidia bacterium]